MIQEILRSSCELYFVLFFFSSLSSVRRVCGMYAVGSCFFASYRGVVWRTSGVDREPLRSRHRLQGQQRLLYQQFSLQAYAGSE